MTIAQREFHTPVLERGTINPSLSAETNGSEECWLYKHVLSLLEEKVVRTVEVVVEKQEVGTKVPL